MRTLFMMSGMGGVMILVITLFRFFTQKYVHRSVFVLLWIIAMLRLCIPFMPQADSSFYNIFQENGYATVRIEEPVDTGAYEKEQLRSGISVTVEPVEEAGFKLSLIETLWIVGSICVPGYFLYVHFRSNRKFRFAIGQKESALGRIRLARMEGLPAPLVYGLLRPKILLPLDFPEDGSEEYWHVLHHEAMHVRCGDLWIKAVALAVVGIHWVNPCAWLMLFLLSEDLEMRCDQRVIEEYGGKRSYAMTLVQAEEKLLSRLVHTCFAFSATRRRLKYIARAKLNPLRSVLVCAVFVTLLVTCFGTRANGEQAVVYVYESSGEEQVFPTDSDREDKAYLESTKPSATDETVGQMPTEKNPGDLPTAPAETEIPEKELATEAVEPLPTEPSTTEATTPTSEEDAVLPEATEPPPTEIKPTEAPTQAPTELATEAPMEAPTDAPVEEEPVFIPEPRDMPYLGSFELVVGQTVSMDVSNYSLSDPTVSDPSSLRAWIRGTSGIWGGSRTIYFTAYSTGHVQVYGSLRKNDRNYTWVLADVYISPNGETDSMSFAEVDGKTPDMELPEFDFDIPD